MRLLLSIPMAFVGSLMGSALRSALKVAEERLDAGPDASATEMNLNVNGSALAAIGGGLMGLLFGTRTAFWSGMALGAAGLGRFDLRLLRLAGIDVDAMVHRAQSMAEQAGRAETPSASTVEAVEVEAVEVEAVEVEAVDVEAGGVAAVETTEIPIESPTSEPA